jgi:hypothetical protein
MVFSGQYPDAEFAPRLYHRNLCIDGGYEICAEMYNKNILASLATFLPKVRASIIPRCEHARLVPASVLSAYTLDLVDSSAIYRLAKDGARECAEGRLRICRKRHYHLVVSLVSFGAAAREVASLSLSPNPRAVFGLSETSKHTGKRRIRR